MNIAKKITIDYLKAGYQNGEFTPYDICLEIQKRAKETQAMNIWIQAPDIANMQPYIERLKTMDKTDAPLWGIPFAIKDNIDLANETTTAGCDTYAYVPNESATTVQLLINAGAIPVGKTNLDQFATGLVGTRSLYGATHNSLKPELISGGSSSGSSVAVAMGQAVFSLGTDTAGSGRVPAALNNLVGLKPTLGAWSTKGVVPACESLDCVTVFAHTLEDAMAVDAVERVEDKQCSWSKKVKPLKVTLPKRICIPKQQLTFYGPFENLYRKAWENVLLKIKKLGIAIEYIDYDIFSEAAAILYDGPWIAERWSSLGEFVEKNNGQAMVAVTETILRSGNKESLKADDVFKAMHRLAQIKCETRKILEDSVLLMPTAGGTYTIEEVNNDPITTNSNMGLYTNHCNLLDLSALNFQAGFAAEDLPFGITSFAAAQEDGLNIGLAKMFNGLDGLDRLEDENQTSKLAVCGLHMRGLPLEYQLTDLNAVFVKESKSAAEYKLYKLPTSPIKPGLVHVADSGYKIDLEVWEIPTCNLGMFLERIPAPLGLGKVKLEDGTEVIGFLCEDYITGMSEDISEIGSFRRLK